MIGDLDGFKRYLDLSSVDIHDALLTEILESANSWATVLCNQSLEYGKATDWLDGTGTSYITVQRFPLKDIHCIAAYSGSTWDEYDLSRDYLSFARDGEVFHSDGFPSGLSNIKIDYSAGFEVSDPEYGAIQWMIYEIGAIIFRNRGVMNLLTVDQGVTITRLQAFLSPELVETIDRFTVRGCHVF